MVRGAFGSGDGRAPRRGRRLGRVNMSFFSAAMSSTRRAGKPPCPTSMCTNRLGDRWFRGEDIPVPVDDSVAGVYRDRYIYLVSGWSKTDAVRDVQVYDAQKNVWSKATPIPGTPVFGHAGAVVGDTIVYVDGAHKNPAGNRAQVRRFRRMLDGQDRPSRSSEDSVEQVAQPSRNARATASPPEARRKIR